MVEINNQRKAFRDMPGVVGGTDNGRQKTRNHGLWRHCRRAIVADYSRCLAKAYFNPKLKSTGAGRYQLLSRWWDAYLQQLGLKGFSPKSQDAVALQQIREKERGVLPMIDRGDGRQAIDRCSNIWASLPGAGYGQFEHKADSWLQNSKKRAERSERLMYEQSHRDYTALVICIIVCLSSWAVNHYRDNAITYKAARQKCRRTSTGERGNYWRWNPSA